MCPSGLDAAASCAGAATPARAAGGGLDQGLGQRAATASGERVRAPAGPANGISHALQPRRWAAPRGRGGTTLGRRSHSQRASREERDLRQVRTPAGPKRDLLAQLECGREWLRARLVVRPARGAADTPALTAGEALPSARGAGETAPAARRWRDSPRPGAGSLERRARVRHAARSAVASGERVRAPAGPEEGLVPLEYGIAAPRGLSPLAVKPLLQRARASAGAAGTGARTLATGAEQSGCRHDRPPRTSARTPTQHHQKTGAGSGRPGEFALRNLNRERCRTAPAPARARP